MLGQNMRGVFLRRYTTYMLQRPIWQRMGIKPGERAYYLNAPAEAITAIGAPDVQVSNELEGTFNYINCFVITEAELHAQFAQLRPHLALGGKLWVSWPKGRQRGSDLTVHSVERIVYEYNLVEGTGEFQVFCGTDHQNTGDPIVFPGQAGKSHMHSFFGNTNAASTTESLMTKPSSCARDMQTTDRSAYWVPALYQRQANDTLTLLPTNDTTVFVYYQRLGNQKITPFLTAFG